MDPNTSVWAGKRVTITGATGFVGNQVALELARQGAQVRALVRSPEGARRLLAAGIECTEGALEDRGRLEQACAGAEVVFHVAGVVDLGNDRETLQRVNVEGTRNVLIAARSSGVQRVVHTSSIVAIGATESPSLLDENSTWDRDLQRFPYAATKREAEELALSFDGVEVVVVNPSCVLGPDDYSGSEFGTLCRRFWNGRVPIHFRGGNNFADVRDVARGQLLAAQHGRTGQRYILGGVNRTFTAFFAELARVAGRAIPRVCMPGFVAPLIAALEQWQRRKGRPCLSPGQAQMATRYQFFRTDKACLELGYQPRPLVNTLQNALAFWKGPTRRSIEP